MPTDGPLTRERLVEERFDERSTTFTGIWLLAREANPRLHHGSLKVIGEDARLLRRPPAGGEHDEGDDRIERVVRQHLRERPGCELLRAHPGRGDGDAEAGQRAGDDARR